MPILDEKVKRILLIHLGCAGSITASLPGFLILMEVIVRQVRMHYGWFARQDMTWHAPTSVALVLVAPTPIGYPRCLVRDWDGEEFARRLKGWFRG